MRKEDQLLYYSFLQEPRISEAKEKKLWESGALSLQDLNRHVTAGQQSGFQGKTPGLDALERNDKEYFLERLPSKHRYRAAYSFPEDVLFLDIETTGLSCAYHYVTMAGWMQNGVYERWVQGTDPARFLSVAQNASLFVTFNGTRFDCPFLDHAFETTLFTEKPNLDLMFLCRRFGLTGGQKSIERDLGFMRPDGLRDTDGKEAVALWYRFLFGADEALDSLIAYNRLDVIGMAYILDSVFFERIYGDEFPRVGRPERFFVSDTLQNIPTHAQDAAAKERVRRTVGNTFRPFSIELLSASFPEQIVGIDLAGKTTSRTGLCLLHGTRAETTVAHTDEEILEFVAKHAPSLISIDAPLSLPAGRTSVYDDDPARDSGGILRWSERELKRRRVNCYPSLIRSMQELTRRGIRLASRFRGMGIPVIECFPGATQDIVQLPRKRTDETLLKTGLMRFGITGPYLEKTVCHDELDAVTAALVGQFFVAGYYEALGIPEENDMIIPRAERREPTLESVILLTGNDESARRRAIEAYSREGYRVLQYEENADPALLRDRPYEDPVTAHRYDLNAAALKRAGSASRLILEGPCQPVDFTFWKETEYNKTRVEYFGKTDFTPR